MQNSASAGDHAPKLSFHEKLFIIDDVFRAELPARGGAKV